MNKKTIFLYLVIIALLAAGALAHHYKLNNLIVVFSFLGIIGGLCQLFIGSYLLLCMNGFFKNKPDYPNSHKTLIPIIFLSGFYLLYISLARI